MTESIEAQALAEWQHQARMLQRLELYVQVLYILMQQNIARETKRDSSGMKSISLLAMIFLPATAIAVRCIQCHELTLN